MCNIATCFINISVHISLAFFFSYLVWFVSIFAIRCHCHCWAWTRMERVWVWVRGDEANATCVCASVSECETGNGKAIAITIIIWEFMIKMMCVGCQSRCTSAFDGFVELVQKKNILLNRHFAPILKNLQYCAAGTEQENYGEIRLHPDTFDVTTSRGGFFLLSTQTAICSISHTKYVRIITRPCHATLSKSISIYYYFFSFG